MLLISARLQPHWGHFQIKLFGCRSISQLLHPLLLQATDVCIYSWKRCNGHSLSCDLQRVPSSTAWTAARVSWEDTDLCACKWTLSLVWNRSTRIIMYQHTKIHHNREKKKILHCAFFWTSPCCPFMRLKTWKSHQPCPPSAPLPWKRHAPWSVWESAYPLRLNRGASTFIFTPAHCFLGISKGFFLTRIFVGKNSSLLEWFSVEK